MANYCPNKNKEQVRYTLIAIGESDDLHHTFTLSAKDDNSRLKNLVKDTLGMALLDSGCTKTVVGKDWLSAYESILDDEDQKNIQHSTFRFGDGARVISTTKVSFPELLVRNGPYYMQMLFTIIYLYS